MSDRLLSVYECAERTSTSASFWRKVIAKGLIPFVKVGRLTRIREGDHESVVPAQRLEELEFLDDCLSHAVPPFVGRSDRRPLWAAERR